jgi:hypothetical protein
VLGRIIGVVVRRRFVGAITCPRGHGCTHRRQRSRLTSERRQGR